MDKHGVNITGLAVAIQFVHILLSIHYWLFHVQQDEENQLDKVQEQLMNELNEVDDKEEDSELMLAEYHSDGDNRQDSR